MSEYYTEAQIRADERQKFAEWLKDNDYLNSIEFTEDDVVIIDFLFVDDVIEEYVKEQKNG